jgi:hypothetical protein
MLLTVFDSGSFTPVAGEQDVSSTTPGTMEPMVAAFNFNALAGCVFAVSWSTQIPGGSGNIRAYRSPDITVVAGVTDGFVTPPVPIYYYSDLFVDLVSGTPAGELSWVIYRFP